MLLFVPTGLAFLSIFCFKSHQKKIALLSSSSSKGAHAPRPECQKVARSMPGERFLMPMIPTVVLHMLWAVGLIALMMVEVLPSRVNPCFLTGPVSILVQARPVLKQNLCSSQTLALLVEMMGSTLSEVALMVHMVSALLRPV